MSDAMGIHISEEAENRHSQKEIWESTIATFTSKFIFALTFIIPILLFELSTAIFVCIVWGLFLISIFSFYIARKEKIKPYRVISEHLIITIAVIVITHVLGNWVSTFT
jgi:VIT1/CCC1 family predicted Fe2+/Mn2+ transporter